MIIRALLAVLAAATVSGVARPATAAAPETVNRSATGITLTVDRVTPTAPIASTKHRKLTVVLSLTNSSGTAVNGVSVTAERGDPIGNQSALDTELARTAAPSAAGLAIRPTNPVTTDLAGESNAVQVTFRTTTSLLDPSSASANGTTAGNGLCLCHNAVYPLYFRATVTGSDGALRVLATAVSFIPSFDVEPDPVQVAWVWPLIDRPHRLQYTSTFTDDALADSVNGGRLSRALSVVENVAPQVPVTLVVDPDLLDELEVMSTGQYRYRAASGRLVAGHGKDAAQAWLSRFQSVVAEPGVQVALTPYADPDVQSLTTAGLSWASKLPDAMGRRVAKAMGSVQPVRDIAWPAATRVSHATLDTLRATGINTVILGDKAVTTASGSGSLPPSVVRLRAAGATIDATLTSSAVRRYVSSSVSADGSPAALPKLAAELAVRAAQAPQQRHLAVLTPPRFVDPDVAAATRTILHTASSPSTEPVSLDAGVAALAPRTTSRLNRVPVDASQLPAAIMANARSVLETLPIVSSLLQDSTAATSLLTRLPIALQRVESAAWRIGSTDGGRAAGLARARILSSTVTAITAGVRIVTPPSGSYTLASGSSPLPITVTNNLDYPVIVDVVVEAAGGLPGFTAQRLAGEIGAHMKQTLNVPTQVDRSGSIRVLAQLHTTEDVALGRSVPLSVHSTVLGLVGVIITITAGVVLVVALLVRLQRRVRRRRAGAAKVKQPSTGAVVGGSLP